MKVVCQGTVLNHMTDEWDDIEIEVTKGYPSPSSVHVEFSYGTHGMSISLPELKRALAALEED